MQKVMINLQTKLNANMMSTYKRYTFSFKLQILFYQQIKHSMFAC